ncbi:hypothetical protein [Roseibium sp.]|uniref:hypothetical protein n=1 Tax=Roseibium sp. TaxID=1936156 RepID=UPI003BACAC41
MTRSGKTIRLFTFQRTPVLDLFDADGCYRPTWEGTGIAGRHRIAYEFVGRHMCEIGLSDGLTPPVWAFEADPGELGLLATMLLSDHELSRSDYVTLELNVPEDLILRTSYGAWCELYFSCLETGRIEDDGKWLDCSPVDEYPSHTAQAILPYVLKKWILSVEPLKAPSLD